MTSSFNLNYQLPNFKILKFLIRSIISGLIMINTDSHSSVTRDIPAESTRDLPPPRWLPHPLTSPLFPDLTLLISFHHTDYNICHLSPSLSVSLCHRDCGYVPQRCFHSKPSVNQTLNFSSPPSRLSITFWPPSFSPLIVVSSVYLLRLTFSISNSWLLLQFLAPVLLTPAIFFTSFVQFFFSRFFPTKKSTSNYPLSLSLTLILPLAQTALLSSWISAFASISSHSIACPLLISHQSPLPSFLASLPPPFFRCLHLFSNSLFFPPGSWSSCSDLAVLMLLPS